MRLLIYMCPHYLYIADLMEYHANVRWWCVTTCDRHASLSSWFLKAAGLSCSTTTGSWFQSWWSAMIGGCRAQQTSMERLNRLREANGPTANGREFQSVMVWGMNEYLKASVRTGSDIHLFSLEALVCRDETWEVIQRNGWKVIKRLVENRKNNWLVTNSH